MEGNLSVGRARGGASESCRTTRLHVQLSRVGESARRKVSSTWYMCPWEPFHAYGGEFVGRWRGICRSVVPEVVHQRVVVQLASTCNLAEWANPRGGRFPARGTLSVGTFSCVWRGICRSVVPEVVHQRVVVQLASTCNLAEWAISPGRRFPARGTCVRVHIFMRMEGNWSVDRARGGVSESCRTSRLQPPLSRVGESARPKVSSTRYMCPWEHFHACGEEIDGRSCPRWCIRELSYNSSPPAT